ncbi:Bax inhibitor-1/YccA family protein [Aridibaculum aurantiacum]|uniref:Bax inhibitor-1/YccA family protein n=1 Tax=Aridibaculum aurantiacum TaxID=2810307 RepID=UPI001A9623F0|nr:Bax inhibitor-1/YccA family protein [Aridibaculum aurantiacum]
MNLFKSGNPTLSEKIFTNSLSTTQEELMTVRGTINKFGFLFLMTMSSAAYTWHAYYQGQNVQGYMMAGIFGGLALALIIAFKRSWSAYLAPLYALVKGLFIGAISAMINEAFIESYPGIIMQAVGLTFGTAIAMFLLYNFGVIKATERFKSIIFTATAGIAIFYLIALVLRMFNIDIPFLHEGSALGIGFSLFVIAIAALNLIIDFDMIEQGAAMGAPKHMEWYCAFGLLVTIIWLYIEILRLLSKLASRD